MPANPPVQAYGAIMLPATMQAHVSHLPDVIHTVTALQKLASHLNFLNGFSHSRHVFKQSSCTSHALSTQSTGWNCFLHRNPQ